MCLFYLFLTIINSLILTLFKIIIITTNLEKEFSCERQDCHFVNENIRIWSLKSSQPMRIRVLDENKNSSNFINHEISSSCCSKIFFRIYIYDVKIMIIYSKSRHALLNVVPLMLFNALLRKLSRFENCVLERTMKTLIESTFHRSHVYFLHQILSLLYIISYLALLTRLYISIWGMK